MPFSFGSLLSYGSVRSFRTKMFVVAAVPAVIFDKVCKLDDKFALFVLLTRFEGVLILPTEVGGAALTKNISHRVQASQEDTVFSLTTVTVHDTVEQICSTSTALKHKVNTS